MATLAALVRRMIMVMVITLCTFGRVRCADGAVRLRDGTGYTGRVEIKYNSLYGTVCADIFDIEDAHVVCRQLGFHYGALRIVRAADGGFGIGTLPINVHDVNCAGDEASLIDCPGFMGNGSCSQSEAAAVFCALPYYEGCYSDPESSLWSNDDGTLDGLINSCRLFQYDIAASSSEVGAEHRCYNGEPTGTLVDDSQCGVVCVNDPNQLCGGTGDVRAVYSTLLGAGGYSMTSDKGTITSPLYPATTTTNDHLVWMVTLSSAQEVEFTFPVFDIDVQDVLTIEAGGVNETFISGRSWTSNPTSSFRVLFDTASTRSNGFILNYQAEMSLAPSTVDSSTLPEATTSDHEYDQTGSPISRSDCDSLRGVAIGLGIIVLLLVIYNAAVTVLYIRLGRPCSDGKKQPADANVKPEGGVYTDLDIQLHSTSPQTQPSGRPLYQGLIATGAAPSTDIQSSASASITDDGCYVNQQLVDQRATRRGAMKEPEAEYAYAM